MLASAGAEFGAEHCLSFLLPLLTLGFGPGPQMLPEKCLQFLLLHLSKCFERVISPKSLSGCLNDPSFHWNFLALDPSEGTGK